MKTIRIMTACAAALLFASCLQVDEPAGIEAIRNAKAELISAEAQYKLAETAYKNAEAAYQQAIAEWQIIQNKLEELKLAKKQAENALEIAEYENQMEILMLEHQTEVTSLQLELAIAEQQLADALAALAEESKGLSAQEERVLNNYITKLETIKDNISTYQDNYNNAVEDYLDAQYSFTFDYDVYKAKYQYDVTVAQLQVNQVNKFAEIVKNASTSDYLKQIADLETAIATEEDAIEKLWDDYDLLEANKKSPLVEQMLALDNQVIEIDEKIFDLELQQIHLFTDNEAYYKKTIEVPATLANEIYEWFDDQNYLDNANGFVKDYETNKWTTSNGTVTVQFTVPAFTDDDDLDSYVSYLETGEMYYFVYYLNEAYKVYKESTNEAEADKKAYSTKTEKYLNDFNALVIDAKKASDNLAIEIAKLEESKNSIVLQKREIELEISKVDVELAAFEEEITNREDVLYGVMMLKSTYEGFINDTEVYYPTFYDENDDPVDFDDLQSDKTYMIGFESGYLDDKQAESVAELLDIWKSYADYWVAMANSNLSRYQQIYDDYCSSDNPSRYAQQTEVETAEMIMTINKARYDFYKAQFELYTKLFNEYLAAVINNTGGSPVTPPTEDPAPENPGEGEGGEAA